MPSNIGEAPLPANFKAPEEKKPSVKSAKIVFTDGSAQTFGSVVEVERSANEVQLKLRELANGLANSPVVHTVVSVNRGQIRWYAVREEVSAK